MAPAVDVRVSPTASDAIEACAAHLAAEGQRIIEQRRWLHLGLSGGTTGARLYGRLAAQSLDWSRVHLFQVDERAAPDDDPARNATALLHELVDRVPVPRTQVHLVDAAASDLAAAARAYGAALAPLELVHLGLGADGHTASWPPTEPEVRTAPTRVVATGPFEGYRRVTLTQRALAEVGHLAWLVCGSDKREALRRALAGDRSMPAGHALALGTSGRPTQVVFADAAAAG